MKVMVPSLFLLACAYALAGSFGDAAIVEHTFHVKKMRITPLCETRVITAVNGRMPGPRILVHEGDTLVVHVVNNSPYNITIHWHGIFQRLTCWADGPNMITQCPIRPGKSYTYRFNVVGQEGTLWWHAHVSFIRATVYGALIIRPRHGAHAYPFPKPDREVPVLLGEWWNANIVDVENQAFSTGFVPNISDAFTINGIPGDSYNCSKQIYKLKVEPGKTYMLRIINAALENQLFFKIAGHSFTVVAVDASYTDPYITDVIVIAPGQTVDALMLADAAPSRYYMAASPYASFTALPFDNSTTRGIVEYYAASPSSPPIMPAMPAFNDTPTAHKFYTNLTSLVKPGKSDAIPIHVDTRMFVTFGMGFATCEPDQLLCNRTQGTVASSMNNASFKFPTKISLLEAHFKNIEGVYTRDFPDKPPLFFDFTNNSINPGLFTTVKATKVRRVKYNSTVEMVLQNTAILGAENHPLHLHGYNFYVIAQGFGNYDKSSAIKSYNLINPQVRNTIAVPVAGWAVIRFTANNPGVWMLHCHLDSHLPFGLAMVFEVENGPTPHAILPAPPPDFPRC
ncbi:laccase-7-like isoform X2 [Typha angustifolia]|uniref:laccase-7-like isoform X2 n=1 Tax=Typha angustifolia TaxID=59011 RepID=UPI003C2B535D